MIFPPLTPSSRPATARRFAAGPLLAGLLSAGLSSAPAPLAAADPPAAVATAETATTAEAPQELVDPAVLDQEEATRRSAAVTLNYCRASLYRIRCNPTDRVLAEERANILSNLNLASIEDEEVLRLYTAVLDEIAAIRIAEQDRVMLHHSHARGVSQHATITAFSLLGHAATADVAGAVRTGAGSWWDVRAMQQDRDGGLWKVNRDRVKGVLDKSGAFLDTSWKLARKRQIPDQWLVRDDDLRRLAEVQADQDPAARLRRLTRLERYLTHHPPYWYALARTQQRLGMFTDAEQTYSHLATLGGGHFRRDQMLAAGWANVAMIREHTGVAGAAEAASQALACGGDAWEVNLAAAGVLSKHGRYAEAEDAVLRNLDGDLEVAQSGAALCVVLADAGTHIQDSGIKLAERLRDPQTVANLPPAALVKCAAAVPGEVPAIAAERLRSSVSVVSDPRQGLILTADRAWGLPSAVFRTAAADGDGPAGDAAEQDRGTVLRPLVAARSADPDREAVRFTDLGPAADGSVRLQVCFGHDDPLTLTFAGPAEEARTDHARTPRTTYRPPSRWLPSLPGGLSGGMTGNPLTARREPPAPRAFTLARVETAGRVVALSPAGAGPTAVQLSGERPTRLSARPVTPAGR